MDVMLTQEGFYANLCAKQTTSYAFTTTPPHVSCNEQQVAISTLWSAVLLSEFTVLPSGILLDYIGTTLFSLLLFMIHVASLVATIYLSRDSPYLYLTFFFMGCAAQGCALLAMRTVYIFNTPSTRKRWIIACCTVFDSSAVCTMIFYNLWHVEIIRLRDMF